MKTESEMLDLEEARKEREGGAGVVAGVERGANCLQMIHICQLDTN